MNLTGKALSLALGAPKEVSRAPEPKDDDEFYDVAADELMKVATSGDKAAFKAALRALQEE